MADKRCPKCRRWSTESAMRCDCGYDFESGRVRASYAQLGEYERAFAHNGSYSADAIRALPLHRRSLAKLGGSWIILSVALAVGGAFRLFGVIAAYALAITVIQKAAYGESRTMLAYVDSLRWRQYRKGDVIGTVVGYYSLAFFVMASGLLADTPWLLVLPFVGGRLCALVFGIGWVLQTETGRKNSVVDHYALWSESKAHSG